MVSAALELSEDDGVETPMLHELHDMLMKLPGPVQDMQGDVVGALCRRGPCSIWGARSDAALRREKRSHKIPSPCIRGPRQVAVGVSAGATHMLLVCVLVGNQGNAIDALVPLIEVARGVEEHGLALAERESIVETSERNLDMAESEVAEQKTAFDRTMEDHKHELLVARAAGGQEGVEALESELIELRLKARAAEDASASKSRLVAKRTGDLQACKDQIERLKAAISAHRPPCPVKSWAPLGWLSLKLPT